MNLVVQPLTARKFSLAKQGAVRTRFAPSPTGFLHIGSARTALFNYIFTKKNKGVFVLRVEDTDPQRSKDIFEKNIIENLKWLGINWDEGPDIEGPFGPYRQSKRGETYKKYIKKLLEEKKAYCCFCTEDELEAKRQDQISRGLAPHYNGKCAGLSDKDIEKKLARNEKYIIRFKTPNKKVKFNDLVRGKLEFDANLLGDFSIAKDLSSPLYNLAVVIDDFEMRITHILRGEDLLPNTPKQILLQEALGFEQPEYGHLPLILGPDRSKLSKRHGAVSLSEYKIDGYLPEAIVNLLALLGWNPGDERELFSLNSLIKEFSVEKVHKSGAIFNIKKLESLNGFYIRQMSIEKITNLLIPYLVENGLIEPIFKSQERVSNLTGFFGREIAQNFRIVETKEKINFEYLGKIFALYRDRLKKLSEISGLTEFFFKGKLLCDKELLRWKNASDDEIKESLNSAADALTKFEEKNWNSKNLGDFLLPKAEEFSVRLKKPGDRGYLLWPFRVAMTCQKSSAGPFEIAEILGKEKTILRIKEAIKLF